MHDENKIVLACGDHTKMTDSKLILIDASVQTQSSGANLPIHLIWHRQSRHLQMAIFAASQLDRWEVEGYRPFCAEDQLSYTILTDRVKSWNSEILQKIRA
jgi:hypothetical protein